MPSANYVNQGSALSILSTGGTSTMDFSSVANGAGRAGSRFSVGTFPRALTWRWYAEFQLQATPTLGQSIDLWLAPWDEDGTPSRPWGDLSAVSGYNVAGFAFGTENDLRNLLFMGSVMIDAAAAGKFTGGGTVEIPTRYVTPIWWNRSGAAATITASHHFGYITPLYDEAQ